MRKIKLQNKSDKKALKHNTIALMIIQILNYVLPFITLPYLARVLTVSDYGLVFFAQVFVDYFVRFVMFGFEYSAVRQVAVHSNNQKSVNHILNSVLFVQIIFFVIGFLVLNIIIFSFQKFSKDWLLYYLTYMGIIGSIFSFYWFYQGMARMKFITILNIITRTIFMILIFTCIKRTEDYILYPLLNSTSMIIGGIISVIFVKKIFNIKFYIPKMETILETIRYSSQFFLTKVAISFYRSTNAFVLGVVVTSTVVAYYVAADRIFWAIYGLYGTFINALFPYMSKNKDMQFFKKICKYTIIISIAASLLVCLTSKYLIYIFFSPKYQESILVLQILSIAFIFYALLEFLGFPFLGAFGYVKETNRGYIVGGIFDFIGLVVLYLCNKINIYSMAIIVLLTFVVMFLHRIYYIHKYKLFKSEEVA